MAADLMPAPLYRGFAVYRRTGVDAAVVYRCFERLPAGGFAVQSADHVHLPIDASALADHERQFWELFIETDPAERQGRLFSTVEDAIAAFDAGFDSDDDAATEAVDARLARLNQVHWGAAADWQPRVKELVLEFAARAQPLVPEDRSTASPVDSAFRSGVLERLSEHERARVAKLMEEVVASGRGRKELPMLETKPLISLVLALAMLVERGDVPPDEDPGEPRHAAMSARVGTFIVIMPRPWMAVIPSWDKVSS